MNQNTKEYTFKQMQDLRESEKDLPIKTGWFKHKTKDIYKCQLDLFKEFLDYEEVV